MRQINKGEPPEILGGIGATFQRDAWIFAQTGKVKSSSEFAADLKKFATYDDDGDFDGYSTGLFTKRSYYSDLEVKRRLIATHHGKCAYCECFIMDGDSGDVEHFRPKAGVTGPDSDDPKVEIAVAGHPGYFWLAASWDNLFLSCKQCNQAHKRNFFDLFPDTPRSNLGNRDVTEVPNLLCPAQPDEELRRLIRYDPATAKALLDPEPMYSPVPDRARDLPKIQRTIDIVGLNRPRLVEARANHLIMVRALFLLVSSKGALPGDHAEPAKTDRRPAILDFVIPEADTSKDAIVALERAIDPKAEFSALTLDALITWSVELKLAVQVAQVSLVEQSTIRLVTEHPSLRASLELAKVTRDHNKDSTLEEAVADITDLDSIYSTRLIQYKAAMKSLKPRMGKFRRVKDEVPDLRKEAEDYFDEHLSAHADLRSDVDAEIRNLLYRSGHQTPDECIVAEEMYLYIKKEFELKKQPVSLEFSLQVEADEKLKREAQSPKFKAFTKAHNGMLAEIDAAEQPLQAFASKFREMREDLIDLKESYRVRGVKAVRRDRCEAFIEALSNLTSWLDLDVDELTPAVKQHLTGRGFPQAIRR